MATFVMRLLQQKRAKLDDFQNLLQQVVQQLEKMPAKERVSWQELLSYIHALVYYERTPAEHDGLHKLIESSVESDDHVREISKMSRTIADAMKEEGAVDALRKTLLLQLRQRFGRIPKDTSATIQITSEIKQLEKWLGRVISAETLNWTAPLLFDCR